MFSSKLVLFGILLGFLTIGAYGHSYLTNPTSRSNQKQSVTGCRGPGCLGPCDVANGKGSTKAVTIARGASINLQWPRNNHAGGFIRVAWTQTANSDNAASFDAGVQEIFCHERGGCKPDSASNPNGGDSNPADGSVNPCQMTITAPLHLTDGTWTLQWAWFGGAFALGDYYSCVDYVIAGGPTGAQQTPFYIGGDYSYPGQNKCKFFNTDRLHRCVNEPCNNPVYPLNQEQSGPAYGITAASSSVTTGSKPVTTGSKPVTTGKPAAITTGAKSNPATPVTTGRSVTPSPVTTGSAAQPSVTSTTAQPETSGGRTICSASTFGYQECVTANTYHTCVTGRDGPLWSDVQSCQVGLTCHPSATANNIYCY